MGCGLVRYATQLMSISVRKGVVRNHRHPPSKAVSIVTNQGSRLVTLAP
jgi:hypothetical protein